MVNSFTPINTEAYWLCNLVHGEPDRCHGWRDWLWQDDAVRHFFKHYWLVH